MDVSTILTFTCIPQDTRGQNVTAPPYCVCVLKQFEVAIAHSMTCIHVSSGNVKVCNLSPLSNMTIRKLFITAILFPTPTTLNMFQRLHISMYRT